MTNTFGLSFSNSALQLIHSIEENGKIDILSAETIAYPFNFKFEELLIKERLNEIGQLIQTSAKKKNLDKVQLAVSLPMYFTYTKKIALPLDVEDEIATKQVQWELEHYLPGTLTDFKVVKSDSSFSFTNYEESLFICINKKIINNLSEMAQSIGASLSKLTADNFSLDGFIRENQLANEKKNQVFLKLDDLSIISHLFLSGKYYISFMNNLYPLKNYSFEDKQLQVSKTQFSSIKNMVDHLPFVSDDGFDLFVYGNAVSDNTYKLIEQNFSYPVQKLKTNVYKKIVETDILKYVEAIGTCIS